MFCFFYIIFFEWARELRCRNQNVSLASFRPVELTEPLRHLLACCCCCCCCYLVHSIDWIQQLVSFLSFDVHYCISIKQSNRLTICSSFSLLLFVLFLLVVVLFVFCLIVPPPPPPPPPFSLAPRFSFNDSFTFCSSFQYNCHTLIVFSRNQFYRIIHLIKWHYV